MIKVKAYVTEIVPNHVYSVDIAFVCCGVKMVLVVMLSQFMILYGD